MPSTTPGTVRTGRDTPGVSSQWVATPTPRRPLPCLRVRESQWNGRGDAVTSLRGSFVIHDPRHCVDTPGLKDAPQGLCQTIPFSVPSSVVSRIVHPTIIPVTTTDLWSYTWSDLPGPRLRISWSLSLRLSSSLSLPDSLFLSLFLSLLSLLSPSCPSRHEGDPPQEVLGLGDVSTHTYGSVPSSLTPVVTGCHRQGQTVDFKNPYWRVVVRTSTPFKHGSSFDKGSEPHFQTLYFSYYK